MEFIAIILIVIFGYTVFKALVGRLGSKRRSTKRRSKSGTNVAYGGDDGDSGGGLFGGGDGDGGGGFGGGGDGGGGGGE